MTLAAQLEAILFAAGEPMPKKRAADLLGVSLDDLAMGIQEVHEHLQHRGLALIEMGNDLELRTAPGAAEIVKKLREGELSRDLGKAGLETLAVILYRGRATRSEIDWIRGVNSSGTVRALLLRGLIEKNENPADKRRMRYQATTDALAHLGISNVAQLPRFDSLKLQVDAAAEEALAQEEK